MPIAAGGTSLINRNVSLQRPLTEIIIRGLYRVTIATANIASPTAESPQNFLNRIRVFGTWRNGQQVPWDISGATAFVGRRIFQLRGNSLFLDSTSGAGTAEVRQPEPSIPFGQVAATFGNIGTYDIEVFYSLPCAPFIPQSVRATNTPRFWWLPEDWLDSLQLQLSFGDATSFGGIAANTTITNFGSGAGTGVFEVYFKYGQLGKLRGTYQSAIMIRNEQNIVGGSVGAIGNLIQLIPLSKQKTTNVIVKTGQVQQGTSGAAFVFSTLTDLMLDTTQIVVDNKIIRNVYSNRAEKESLGDQWDTVVPQGYFLFSFMGSGNPRSAFRGDNPAVVGPGAQFAVVTNVITPGAHPAASVIQEQIYAQANDPFWTLHQR